MFPKASRLHEAQCWDHPRKVITVAFSTTERAYLQGDLLKLQLFLHLIVPPDIDAMQIYTLFHSKSHILDRNPTVAATQKLLKLVTTFSELS